MYLISANVKLFTSDNFNYYKVEVSNGLQMTTDTVVDTCQAAGLRAVCPGPSSCGHSNPTCYATPLTPDRCEYLNAVSDHMCNTTDAKRCPAIDNMFVMMNNNWDGRGASGVVGNQYLAHGKNYVSGEGGQSYFAYCVRCGDCSGWNIKQLSEKYCLYLYTFSMELMGFLWDKLYENKDKIMYRRK